MGIGTVTSGNEQATVVYTATITGTGAVALLSTFPNTASSPSGLACSLFGYYNLTFYGTFTATARLERSFDGGVNWVPVSLDTSGDVASYSAPVTVSGFEVERGMFYRMNCTAYTSGTINVRISQNANTFPGKVYGT